MAGRIGWWAIIGALASAGCSAGGYETVDTNEEPVLFGNVSRQQYKNATATNQERATAVGVLMQTSDITFDGGACPDPATGSSFDCTVELNARTPAQISAAGGTPLCAHDINTVIGPNELTIDFSCTAFMIGQDLFATAAHCITPDGLGYDSLTKLLECANRSVVLRWRPSDDSSFPNGNPSVLERHVYQCVEVVNHGRNLNGWLMPDSLNGIQQMNGLDNDWAIFRVDRPVSGGTGTGGPITPAREPLALATSAPVAGTTGLSTIGHPYGHPIKIDPEVTVQASPSPTREPGTFTTKADVAPGLSGGPVINADGTVAGIWSAGVPLLETDDPRFPGKKCEMECFGTSAEGSPVCNDPLGDAHPIAVQAICLDRTPGGSTFCSTACPCNAGAGDCDKNSECAPGLSCHTDVGLGYRMGPSTDVCLPSACSQPLGHKDYCLNACPCGYGSGDCDSDAQCMDGLVCATDYGSMFKMTAGTDVCVTAQCAGRTVASGSFCTEECPCGHGGGDCDSDADCILGLVCVDNVGATFGMSAATDVCMPPACGDVSPGASTFCSTDCPCGNGGGDCDDDAECMPGLHCGTNNGASFGFSSSTDVCVP
jgi:hypothetical protein